MSNEIIGITERGDAALDWVDWWDWVVDDGRPAILISKDPARLAERLARAKSKLNVIVHATITGWGCTPLEPNVPVFTAALRGLDALIALIGAERVVLRVDPVIPSEEGVAAAREVIGSVKGLRVRTSFIDLYPHVRDRLAQAEVVLPGVTWSTFHAPLNLRRQAWQLLGQPEVCGEPDFVCIGCVSTKDCEILQVAPATMIGGQRSNCTCLAMKAELLHRRAQCPHGCLYCYWR